MGPYTGVHPWAATVAEGWSGYLVSVMEILGITVPPALYANPKPGGLSHDYLAVLVIIAMTIILVLGIKLSSQFNQVITGIKVPVTIFIIGFGVWFIDAANLTPFYRRRRSPRPSSSFLPRYSWVSRWCA